MKTSLKTIGLLILSGTLLPVSVYAQNFSYIETFLSQVGSLVEKVAPLLIAVALLVFIWGLVDFIRNSGDGEAKTKGRDKMVWGVIGLFVAVSIFGILSVLVSVFNVGNTSTGHRPPEIL